MLLLPVAFLVSKWTVKRNFIKFAVLFWLAAISHMVLDALSGGVSLFYPWGDVVGTYFISYPNWVYFDIGFVSGTMVLLFIRFLIKKRVLNYSSSNP
jgi:hypothetical protein